MLGGLMQQCEDIEISIALLMCLSHAKRFHIETKCDGITIHNTQYSNTENVNINQ